MSDPVIVALITGICAVVGQWLISRSQNEKRKVDEAIRDARLEDRLRSVEKKLDEHNGYAARFASITESVVEMRNDIKWLKESKYNGSLRRLR